MDCNCLVGKFDGLGRSGFIDLDKLFEILTFELQSYKKFKDVFKEKHNLNSILDYVDQRRGYGLWFNYCPLCGKKLDWIKIKKELRLLEKGVLNDKS